MEDMRLRVFASTSSTDTDAGGGVYGPFSWRGASGICSVIALLVSTCGSLSAVRADGTLTLELPPSQAALDAREAARDKAAAQSAHTSVIPDRYRTPRTSPYGYGAMASRGHYAARGKTSTERVVGTLGQLVRQAPIYRIPSSRTYLLTHAPSGTYLALQEQTSSWFGVLMADGSTGWLRKQYVHVLNYAVTQTGTPSAPRAWDGSVAMPAGSDPGDIYPRSDRPYFTGDPNLLVQEAYRYLGVRYVWGGNTSNGIDCSGFVKNVFAACGFPLPRLGSDQMAYGVPVPASQLQPGDRLYFGRRHDRLGVTHTGLYIGNGLFIHSATSTHGVAISQLMEPRFWRIFVCARR